MIYIHIPFCVKKCLYCDFYSVTDRSIVREYIDALKKEMLEYKGKKTETVYIGGGTPTSIGDSLLEIISFVNDNFDLSENCEFTVEANPGTVNADLLGKMRNIGVNRISLGAQSFSDNELKALGRIHNSDDIFSAVRLIRKAGFSNLSLDLMLAIPLQTIESLNYSLDCIERISPEHVSAYSLIIEENTPFFTHTSALPDEDTEREMYYTAVDRLEKMGIYRYEISNFAKKGYESRHNSRYWQDYEYIGFGAGAHSYYNKARYCNAGDIKLYNSGKGRKLDFTPISSSQRKAELFMLGLRMTDGIEYRGEFPEKVNKLIYDGLLEITDGKLRLTHRGIDLGNLVFMEFV